MSRRYIRGQGRGGRLGQLKLVCAWSPAGGANRGAELASPHKRFDRLAKEGVSGEVAIHPRLKVDISNRHRKLDARKFDDITWFEADDIPADITPAAMEFDLA